MRQGCVLGDSYGQGRLTVPSLLGTTETLGPRWCLPRVFPAKLRPCLCGDKCFLGDHLSCKVLLPTQLLPPFSLSIDVSCLSYDDDGGNCANVIIPSAFTTWHPIVTKTFLVSLLYSLRGPTLLQHRFLLCTWNCLWFGWRDLPSQAF